MGCPFNTGNETFGLDSQFKRAAALGGDFGLHALRRLLSKAAASVGVQGYGFLFTDPPPQQLVPAYLGGEQGSAYFFLQWVVMKESVDCYSATWSGPSTCLWDSRDNGVWPRRDS